VQRGDVAQVAMYSHRIKGSSRTIGANELAAACERLERAARDRNTEAMSAALAAFDSAVRGLEIFIRARAAA
jgi:HPt (histidine-containing phosphotransfer) domain-containing protein